MDDDLDQIVRRNDPDRWLSSRFIADPQARADVVALYAFDHELARAPRVASNPLLGEIRLTWWREVLDEVFDGRPVRRHPTAQALAELVRRRGLMRDPLEALIDARYRELDPQPMTDDEARLWALETGGGVARLASALLDPGSDPEAAARLGAVWALWRRGIAARPPRERISAAAFPAVAHATFARRPAGSELGRRLRLILAVAVGRV